MLTLSEARETGRLPEFTVRSKDAASVRRTGPTLMRPLQRSLDRADQWVEHRVLHRAVVRPEGELPEIASHVFRADVDVRRPDRSLEQPPEALNRVRERD